MIPTVMLAGFVVGLLPRWWHWMGIPLVVLGWVVLLRSGHFISLDRHDMLIATSYALPNAVISVVAVRWLIRLGHDVVDLFH